MATWHEEMAEAVRLRQKAINGVLRWQGKKKEAEDKIEQLSAQVNAGDPVPAVVTQDDGAVLDTDLVSTFGVTNSVSTPSFDSGIQVQ